MVEPHKLRIQVKPEYQELYEKKKNYKGDVGFDLYITETIIVAGNSTILIGLGIYCESVDNLAYELRCRSSIYKTPIRLSNSVGTIDANYRGEIMAAIDNIRSEDYTINKGDRLFQLVYGDGRGIEPEYVDELTTTNRNSNGFGSTGK